LHTFCKSLPITLLSFAAATLAVTGITGCSGIGSASFPDAAPNPAQVPVGTIQGSVYGGHAPLIGAHVYLLSPGTSGYGSQASSLLCATLTGSAQTSCDSSLSLNASDPNIPTTWYYTTTDATGAFSLTGDYTCTAGNPVYIYAYGGSPTYPSAGNAFSISTINVESRTNGNTTYTILFTVDPAVNPVENFYAGEQITLSGFSGNYAFLNGTVGYVASNSLLSTSSFELSATVASAESASPTLQTYTTNETGNNKLNAGSQSVGTDGLATALPGFNPAVVNLATLGVCPSTGTLASGGTLFNGSTSSAINYIYMNEVSTAVTATVFEGFTPATVTGTTNATDIGTSPTNLIGIENAALNAALLYDINGSQITTSYAGEGHIANPKTPAGNGRTPQFLVDTLGNILAAGVDSNNSSTVDGNAGESAQCTTLFENATSNGIPKSVTGYGTIPVDTAQAMLNIAHYPAGDPGSTATFMANLYGLPSGNVPFTPHLTTQPNDFTVAIQYSYTGQTNTAISSAGSGTITGNTYADGPESVAIDGYGNVWLNSKALSEIFEVSPQGNSIYASSVYSSQIGYITIDPDNNIYAGSNYVAGEENEIAASGTFNQASTRSTYTYTGDYGGTTAPFNAAGFYNGYMSVANGTGNVYISAAAPAITNSTATTAQAYILGLTGSMNLATPGTFTSLFTPVSMATAVGSIGSHGTIENASTNGTGDIWFSDEEYVGATSNAFAIVRFNPATKAVESGFPIQYATNTTIDRPEMPAIDQSGNLWAAGRLNNVLFEVTQAGTVTTNHTGNTLN
jgi:hypothetical protein